MNDAPHQTGAAVGPTNGPYSEINNSFDAIDAVLGVELRNISSIVASLIEQQKRIAQILARFAAAPISISSIQPILELNDELNGAKE